MIPSGMIEKKQGYGDSCKAPGRIPPSVSQRVKSRTVELAIREGRSSVEIRQCDYEQAKRELTGETDFDRQLAVLYPMR